MATTAHEIKSPIVIFKSKDFIEAMPRFLIDTGSELNIVKSKLLKPSVPIQKDTLYRLAGITEGLIEIFGYVNLKINRVQKTVKCRIE